MYLKNNLRNILTNLVKYLSSTIKMFSLKSIKEMIDSYLIISAKELLINSGMSIQQIADESNFTD